MLCPPTCPPTPALTHAAYKRVTAPEDWRLGATMTDWRMRHADGLRELQAQMQRHFLRRPLPLQPPPPPAQRQQQQQEGLGWSAAGVAAVERLAQLLMPRGGAAATEALVSGADGGPPATEAHSAEEEQERQQQHETREAKRQFAAFTYLSQLQQALAYQTAVHQWRRNKADPAARVRVHAAGVPGPAGVLLLVLCWLLRPWLVTWRVRSAHAPHCCPRSLADHGGPLLAAQRRLAGPLLERHQRRRQLAPSAPPRGRLLSARAGQVGAGDGMFVPGWGCGGSVASDAVVHKGWPDGLLALLRPPVLPSPVQRRPGQRGRAVGAPHQ